MEKYVFGKKIICLVLVMSFMLSACMPSDVPTSSRLDPAVNGSGINGPGVTTSGSSGGATNGSIGPKVELRHLIEPNLSTDPNYNPGTGFAGGGTYLRKLSLPKNFQGKLYVAGINVGSLADRHVKVRFKFGVARDPITLNATVTQAPGITPQTNINVLVIDMRNTPFSRVRLPYDLYDYNDYDSGSSPVQDNRNSELYCRGLKLEDDPTFNGVGECDGAQPDEQCLYAYAKVMDQGLVKVNGNVLSPISPDLPQVKSIAGDFYKQDHLSIALRRTLPDTASLPFVFSEAATLAGGSTDSTLETFTDSWNDNSISSGTYIYRGPYRLVNSNQWHFNFADLSGEKRLFEEGKEILYFPGNYGALPDDPIQSSPFSQFFIYYNSYMFPRATKLNLNANITHLSSETWNGVRSPAKLSTAGKTDWMDGSNARAQSRNSDLEHIGSCNVTSSIEVLAKDGNGVEYVVATSTEVKLQLVRSIQHFTDSGNDVLYSNFKTCTSNSTCGGSECCFYNRCWDNTLVSACYDSSSGTGNNEVGESCITDLECSSLCCNRTTGLCAPHNTLLSPAVLCSKPVGDFCIAKEWCQKSTVIKCLVVKTGTDPLGNVTCRQQCYPTQENGDCKAGICTPPIQETIPVFDPDAPGACNNAVPPPSF